MDRWRRQCASYPGQSGLVNSKGILMPLRNRVNPEGEIVVSDARGTLMGNRGCLHNEWKEIVAISKRDAWVTCLLEFQGRHRPIMEPGSYTELFFLDEATALAAGHRPCATCRRDRYDAFMVAWGKGNRGGARVLAGEVDKQMKLDRASNARRRVRTLEGLPDGVMVKASDRAVHLLSSRQLFPWSFHGYSGPVSAASVAEPFVVLTPESTVNAIGAGYVVGVHESCR